MTTVRTARETELPTIRAFDEAHVGGDRSLDDLRATFGSQSLFVVVEDGGELVAVAYGRETRPAESPTVADPNEVSLLSIGVRRGARGRGYGRTVLEGFERRAARQWDVVGAAAANNVEGFYRACGYEPALILVRVSESELPAGDTEAAAGRRRACPGVRDTVPLRGVRLLQHGSARRHRRAVRRLQSQHDLPEVRPGVGHSGLTAGVRCSTVGPAERVRARGVSRPLPVVSFSGSSGQCGGKLLARGSHSSGRATESAGRARGDTGRARVTDRGRALRGARDGGVRGDTRVRPLPAPGGSRRARRVAAGRRRAGDRNGVVGGRRARRAGGVRPLPAAAGRSRGVRDAAGDGARVGRGRPPTPSPSPR
ncbi:MAG: acetyltransferase [halophilic archaeon J07HB67]|nr:MAG: acetyltransferase [halophilic archaeon J07HB67]